MNFETFLGLGGIVGFIVCGLIFTLAICGIIMPVVVLLMSFKLSKIEETLRLMEDMMRNGK